MEVILLKDVESLGKEGDTVKAKDGYARNYLIPRKLAAPYSANAVKTLEEKRRNEAREAQKVKDKLEELANKISQLSITIPVESGMNDMLFGSVTPDMIFHALQHEGVQIDKKQVIIEEPIRKLGIYNITVKLHPEIKANLRVWVVKK